MLQKTYTEDYLSKKIRKNRGEVKQYLVENSHEPIIEPSVFDRVQELMAKRRPYRAKLRDNSPFCNKLVCDDCGGFYGHKVWHNHSNTEKYDVWYCNQRYMNGKACETPILHEEEIRLAFERVLEILGEQPVFSEDRWRSLVESVKVQPDRRLLFTLSNGVEQSVVL